MATALIYLVVMALVAAVLFLVAALVFGRGEELSALPRATSPTQLPVGGLGGEHLRAVRFGQVVRGYRMTEVDWVLDRAAAEIDRLRARVAELEQEDAR